MIFLVNMAYRFSPVKVNYLVEVVFFHLNPNYFQFKKKINSVKNINFRACPNALTILSCTLKLLSGSTDYF